MVYGISGLTLSASPVSLLPKEFAEALNGFSSDEAGGCPDISISVERGDSPAGEPIFSSDLIELLSASDGSIIYRFSGGRAKCALRFFRACGKAIFYIYGDIGLEDPVLNEQTRVLIRLMFEEYSAFLGRLSFHSSALVFRDEAICFTGPSGAGKSTLSVNWMKEIGDSFLLNGDRPMLRLCDGEAQVFGMPWSGKETCFVNKNAPLKAIIEVRQHPKNRLRRLSYIEAFTLIMQRVSKPLWNADAVGSIMDTAEILAQSVPVYRFDCINAPSAAREVFDELFGKGSACRICGEEKDMKIKDGFVVRKILDEYIAVPTGTSGAAAQGAIMLSEVGAFIWHKLENRITESELVSAVLDEFDVERETALADTRAFLETLRGFGVLDGE